MKKIICLLAVIFVSYGCKHKTGVFGSSESQEIVNLILDTDLGPDYDDVGAMALMHALADSGMVNVLGVMSSNHDKLVLPCVEVLNVYFNRPDIPLGAPKSTGGASLTTWHKDKWTEHLSENYPHKLQKTSDATDAVTLYRKLLSEQPDTSVVICTIGFFTNLKDLLLSQPDKYSSLGGVDLVGKKVKRLVSMAGSFPNGREFNVFCDTPASRVVADQWPTEIVFSGFEIGDKIFTGKTLIAQDIQNSPVKDSYAMCMKEGDFDGRMSWDQTAVLVAIKGYEPYYDVERGVFSVVDDEGNNNWESIESGKDLRLIEKVPAAQMAQIIENYMMHKPF